MASYYKRDVKNDFVYVLHFFSLVSGGLGGVKKGSNFLKNCKIGFSTMCTLKSLINKQTGINKQGWNKMPPCLLIYEVNQ